LRTEATRLLPVSGPNPSAARPASIDRLTLVVSSSYPLGDRRRDLLTDAGEAAGFAEVELVGSAAAIVLDSQASHSLPDGSLVLVCDLGQTWSTVLMRVYSHDVVPLAQESASSGRDLDTQLLNDLRVQMGDWLERRLALPGDDGLRARYQAVDFVRQIKHELSGLDNRAEVTGQLATDGPGYTLTREWLDRLAEPGLRWAVASCRSLLARASASGAAQAMAGPGLHTLAARPGAATLAPNSTIKDVQAVLLAGGHARLAAAERMLHQELGRPVVRLDDPDLAALRGAVRFVAGAPTRRIPADHSRWRVESLCWDVPTGRARLERWSTGLDEAYRAGDVLAQVRTLDERVYELIAPEDGVLFTRRGQVGDVVGPTLLASAKRPAKLLAGDMPGKRQEMSGLGEWLYTPDRRVLVECAPSADAVRLWSFPDGVLLREVRPVFDGSASRRGRVFVQPAGHLALVAWDCTGAFWVWDLRTGSCTTAFRDAGPPTNVLVNEREWRLSTEGEDSGTGRYRRTVSTVWDLATGRRVEKLTDNRHRPRVGYERRSVRDRFGHAASSPDGRLRAVPVLGKAGPVGVSLRMTASEQEVFRAEHPPSARVRVAFSADGQFLLANRESPQDSHVDVWEL
jgi:hypothetical protein